MKFKIFDKIDRKMWNENKGVSLEILVSTYQEVCLSKNFKILRYTELKDKNGKEIYEGDILKMEWMKKGDFITAEVKYGSGGFYLPKYDFLNISVKHDEIPDGEAIGNIFENPGLLK